MLFQKLNLKARLKQCFQPVKGSAIFGPHRIVLLLIVHLLLGFRRLRDVDYYRDDPLVQRLLGLHRLPDVATICRTLAAMGRESVQKVRQLSSALVLDALRRGVVAWPEMSPSCACCQLPLKPESSLIQAYQVPSSD